MFKRKNSLIVLNQISTSTNDDEDEIENEMINLGI